MIDEWDNDCPYDFKNILYVERPTFDCTMYGVSHTYTMNGTVINLDGVNYYGYTRTRTSPGPPPPPEKLYSTEESPTTTMTLYEISDSTANPYTGATIDSVSEQNGAYFTFTTYYGKDATLYSDQYCYNNRIRSKVSHLVNTQYLNVIFFTSTSTIFNCYNNSFGSDCSNNRLGSGCYNNSFGSGCYNNSFGSDCSNNRLGSDCYNNSFGRSCSNNTFGSNCYNNSFDDNVYSNIIGYNCSSLTFGQSSYNNVIGSKLIGVNIGGTLSFIYVGENSDGEVVQKNLFD